MSKKYKKYKNKNHKLNPHYDKYVNNVVNMVQGFTDEEIEFVVKCMPELRTKQLLNNK
jgi:hypothetical protein